MLFVKGALISNDTKDSKDNVGLKILLNELSILKDKERSRVNCIVIMGPLLNSKNQLLTGFMDRTFEEEAADLIKLIKDEISKII
jgi:hypothetical protein